MSKTVVGLFDDFTQAQRAVQALESSGIPRNDISLVANNTEGQYDQYANTSLEPDVTDSATNGAGTGATAGAVVGGGLGLLAGLGLMAIPGFGPIVAAGWIVSTITGAGIGAAMGGVLGALVGAGVPHEEATLYDEGVRRGGTLIAVKTADDMAGSTADTLSQFGAVNIDERAESYRQPFDSSNSTPATPPASNDAFNINSTTLPPAPPVPVPPPLPATTSLASDQFQPASNAAAPVTTPGYAPFEAIDTSHQRRDALDDFDYESDFRSNYNRTYANSGLTYDQYAPAYQYGYGLNNDERFRGKDWNSAQYDIQRDWESRQPGTWDRFSNAIRYAWDKATGAERGGIQTGGHALDGTPDTRGVTEKIADAITGDRIDDKTGKPVG